MNQSAIALLFIIVFGIGVGVMGLVAWRAGQRSRRKREGDPALWMLAGQPDGSDSSQHHSHHHHHHSHHQDPGQDVSGAGQSGHSHHTSGDAGGGGHH